MSIQDGKPWYTSKTLWFNIVTLALGIVQLVSDVYIIPEDYLALILGVGNLVLRFLTSKPLTM